MRVVKGWGHEAARGIQHTRCGADQRLDFTGGTHGENPAISSRHRFSGWIPRV
jgi:hypothetical protein